VGVGVGVAVGEGVVVVVVGLGAAVELVPVADVDGLVTGGPAVEHAPSSPRAATSAGARYPCMNDGNPSAWPPTER
jgi:hypothetical protein